MAFNSKLDYEITPAQALAIKTDLLNSKNTLLGIANVTLSKKEAKPLRPVNNHRLPYIQKAVNEFGPAHPDLVSKRVSTVRAGRLLTSLTELREVEFILKEYMDRVKDLRHNTEELLFRYRSDMYREAKRYRGDLPGAEVVSDYLAEEFRGQGVKNAAAGNSPE